MANPPPHDAGDGLSEHLEALFSLAQVMTRTPEDALRLVRQTLQRARQDAVGAGAQEAEPGAVRLKLMRMLAEESRRSGLDEDRDHLQGLKRRLAHVMVDRTAPAAFADLPRRTRTLLMLVDVHGLSAEEASSVLSTPVAAEDVSRARAEFRRRIMTTLAPAERRVVTSVDAEQWVREAVRRVAETELSALPPTFQPPSAGVPSEPAEKVGSGQPARDAKERSWGHVLRRAVAVVLIIAVAGLLGYGFSVLTDRAPDVNLISLSAEGAGELEATFETASAEQAERYVRDRLARRITVPSIQGAALQGVSIRVVAEGAETPVLIYSNVDGSGSVAVYVYSYAFLDAHEDDLQLSPDVLTQIESEGFFDLHDLGDAKALVWRQRDDIYIAITGGDAEALQERISLTS